ncbi:hypothetical protein KP509_15G003700 [Ceratopteris richardii]|uniref:Uncharacterized protein n=1 Tax=Ceratopteris richardii TaxID=49495 RepID=A0A8T2T2B2_CERRI|nr:hypothetical protein KP509_15G003700 [Ceratopteris richardii]
MAHDNSCRRLLALRAAERKNWLHAAECRHEYTPCADHRLANTEDCEEARATVFAHHFISSRTFKPPWLHGQLYYRPLSRLNTLCINHTISSFCLRFRGSLIRTHVLYYCDSCTSLSLSLPLSLSLHLHFLVVQLALKKY